MTHQFRTYDEVSSLQLWDLAQIRVKMEKLAMRHVDCCGNRPHGKEQPEMDGRTCVTELHAEILAYVADRILSETRYRGDAWQEAYRPSGALEHDCAIEAEKQLYWLAKQGLINPDLIRYGGDQSDEPEQKQ